MYNKKESLLVWKLRKTKRNKIQQKQTKKCNTGLGKGKTITGKRNTSNTTTNTYFIKFIDLYQHFRVNETKWRQMYLYDKEFINVIHKTIYKKIKPLKCDNKVFQRNRLLLFLDWTHNHGKNNIFEIKYNISYNTLYIYIFNIIEAIIATFRGTVCEGQFWFSPKQEEKMKKILSNNNKDFPSILYVVDGTHKRCKGHQKKHLSWKDSLHPNFNIMIITDRVFGMINQWLCQQNSHSVNDINMLQGSKVRSDLIEDPDQVGRCILADSGYIGCIPEYVLAIPALNFKGTALRSEKSKLKKIYNQLPPKDWKKLQKTRQIIETNIGIFFYNNFRRLYDWNMQSTSKYYKYCQTLQACIMIYNFQKITLNKLF